MDSEIKAIENSDRYQSLIIKKGKKKKNCLFHQNDKSKVFRKEIEKTIITDVDIMFQVN